MIDKWAHLGHQLGECFYCGSTSATYVHIPKNASSFIKSCLLGTKDWFHCEKFITNNQYLIALRDPIERWVSGMAQFIQANPQTAWTEEVIFDTITFDDHTEEQVYFLQSLNLEKDLAKCTFFLVNDSLSSKIFKWQSANFVKWENTAYPTHNEKFNVGSNTEGRAEIVQRLWTMIDNNPDNLLKLKQHFSLDYELFNSVTFYD